MNEMVDTLGVAPLRAEDRLRQAIVTGRLQPNERLVESDLARALGVSRTVIRGALARLEHEGLVEHERHRGARVRLVSESEAVEILETRSVLEGLAARLAAERATAADVEDLKGILAEMQRLREADDLLAVSDLNAQLHRRLLEISGHETAARLIGTLNSQMVRFQYRTILLPGRSERSFAEHGHAHPPLQRGRRAQPPGAFVAPAPRLRASAAARHHRAHGPLLGGVCSGTSAR